MGTAYYYFAATLPLLEFDRDPPISTETFLADCKRLLSARDFDDVVKAIEGRDEEIHNELLKQLKKYLRNFKIEAAWFRAHRLNKDPMSYIRGERIGDPFMLDLLMRATKMEDPLEATKLLSRDLWSKLDELTSGHMFDFEYIVAYGIKLQMLERFQKIRSAKGQGLFEKYQNEALQSQEG